MELSPSPTLISSTKILGRHHSHREFPVSPLCAKSEGSSPFNMDKTQSRFFKSQQLSDSPRSSSSQGSSGVPEEPLIEKGLTYFLSSITDKVESSYLKVKSTTNIPSDTSSSQRSTPIPILKKERSQSVSSYLLSPPDTPHLKTYTNQSASPSPRNLSLPANRLFFFPPNFSNSDHQTGHLSSDNSRSVSRKASDNSEISRTPLSSRTGSPSPIPMIRPQTQPSVFYRSRSPSPCMSPAVLNSTYSTPLPRRNFSKIKSGCGGGRRGRKFSVSEGNDLEELANVFGLDPKLYTDENCEKDEKLPENHLGRVYFNLRYDKTSECLAVRILNIKNIPRNNKEIGMIYKTYISICLIPDERSERRAYQSSNTFSDHNPIFNECFFFQVSPQDMAERILKLKIYNIDVNRKHKIIGQVLCGLKDLNWEKTCKIDMAMDISKYTRNSLGDKCSEILLSLCYNPSISRLTVNVLEGKDLCCKNNKNKETQPDSYVRVSLNYHTKSKSILEKDHLIGSCILGGPMFARGKGEEHWQQCLKYSKQHVEMWHPLVSRSEKKGKDSTTKLIAQDSTSAQF